MEFTLKNAAFLIKTARNAIEKKLKNEDFSISDLKISPKFKENRGVFVSLHTFPENELRGCIGLPYQIKPLIDAVVDAAASSATRDPRFEPLTVEELKNVVIEITILTKPEQISVQNPNEYLNKIKVGEDGLIIECGVFCGLLLPQVPVEYNWNVREFLSNTCVKAGLPEGAWLNPNTKIYKFSGEVFSEKTPGGEIFKKQLI